MPRTPAALLAEMHTTGRTIPELPDGLRPGTLAESYAIQDALHAALAVPVGALKVGCTSTTAQQALRIDEPIAGRLPTTTLYPDAATIEITSFHHPPFLECEFGLRVGAEIAHDDPVPADADATWALVDAVVPAIELVDSRFTQTFGASPLSLIADNAVAAAAVLGEPVLVDAATPPALAPVAVTLIVDGVEVAAGTGADVLGDPIRALQWVIGHELAPGSLHRRRHGGHHRHVHRSGAGHRGCRCRRRLRDLRPGVDAPHLRSSPGGPGDRRVVPGFARSTTRTDQQSTCRVKASSGWRSARVPSLS